MDDWPFDQPPNCVVIALRQIVFGSAPIPHVTHEADDHGRQLLGREGARMEDAAVVSLAAILRLDPSVREVADLPPGWRAFRRAVGAPWTREPNAEVDDAADA